MPGRVLIVDDEPNIIGTVVPLLRAHGYEVSSAMSGRAALDVVERDKPDVIVALRRIDTSSPAGQPIVRGDLVIDRERFRVSNHGEEVRLTPKEFELLTYLAQRPGRVVTHRMILKAIWGPNAVDQPEHLRVLIGALRKKIEDDPSRPKYIVTEPWVGYRFTDVDGVGG